MVDGRVMPIGRPAPIVDGTNATKLTHEDSVPISPSDELRVVLAVKRASGIPVVKKPVQAAAAGAPEKLCATNRCCVEHRHK